MELRKAATLVAIVVLVVAAGGCKTVAKSDYHVISLKDANHPELGCGNFPKELKVRKNTKWIVIANYAPKDPGDPNMNSVKVQVDQNLTNGNHDIVKELFAGEIMTFKLNRELSSGTQQGITFAAPGGYCTSGLPNPQIVIP